MSDEQPWRQQLKGVRAFVETLKEPEAEERETIAGKFAEALGNIECAIAYLGQVNKQYLEQHIEDGRLMANYGLPPCTPALDFWLQTEQAEDALKGLLHKLQRVEPLAPKKKEGSDGEA